MTTLMFNIDQTIADRARLVAERRQTTLDTLVQQFLERLAGEADTPQRQASEQLLETIQELSRPFGGKPWLDRDELYDR